MSRTEDHGNDILEAALDIGKIRGWKTRSRKATGEMANIPLSHKTYYARIWEGTSGDRVANNTIFGFKGRVFATVAPRWAWSQDVKVTKENQDKVNALIEELRLANLPVPGETVTRYYGRIGK